MAKCLSLHYNYHKLSGFNNQNLIFGVPEVGYLWFALVRILFLVYRQMSSCYIFTWLEDVITCTSLSKTTLVTQDTTLVTLSLPTDPPSNTTVLACDSLIWSNIWTIASKS